MSKTLKVSIALCTYNGERFLCEQLNSFQKQTRLADEVVACDDGSTDRTVEILNAWANGCPFPVRVIQNEKNLGFVQNFVKALNLCDGDVAFLSDQDDIWQPNKIAAMIQQFEDNPDVGLVCCDSRTINATGATIQRSFRQTIRRGQDFFLAGFVNSGKLKLYSGCCMALRTKLVQKMLPIPDGWYHDFWFNILSELYTQAVYIPEELVLYRRHESNVTRPGQIVGCGQECTRYYYRSQLFLYKLYRPAINELRRRLESQPHCEEAKQRLRRLDQAETHIQNRKRIQSGSRFWPFLLLFEFLSLRYFRFPQPFRSILFDFKEGLLRY